MSEENKKIKDGYASHVGWLSDEAGMFSKGFWRKTPIIESAVIEEDFAAGFRAKQKETVKILLDLKNEYKSKLAEQRVVKLGKRIDLEKEMVLEASIDTIDKILKKVE